VDAGFRSGVSDKHPILIAKTVVEGRSEEKQNRRKFLLIHSLERWLSGRKHRFAKAAWGSNLTAGSNPALSASLLADVSQVLDTSAFAFLSVPQRFPFVASFVAFCGGRIL
jgi:hypothetical protein